MIITNILFLTQTIMRCRRQLHFFRLSHGTSNNEKNFLVQKTFYAHRCAWFGYLFIQSFLLFNHSSFSIIPPFQSFLLFNHSSFSIIPPFQSILLFNQSSFSIIPPFQSFLLFNHSSFSIIPPFQSFRFEMFLQSNCELKYVIFIFPHLMCLLKYLICTIFFFTKKK